MNKKLDLTEGPVFANLLRFSLPLITMNLLQAIYNIADMAIAGHLTNPEGMTAITTSGQITNIILVLIIGFSNGINIITGQFVGAGKEKGIKDIFQTTVPVFGLLAIFISLMIGLFSGPLLRLLNMPSAAFDYAKDYLLICLCGTIFIYLYNTMAAILRGMGNSFYPMLFVVISTVSNIILDYLLMGPMHMGVKGAALATIISQAASLIMIVLYFLKKTDYLKIKGLRFHIQPQIIKMLVKVGLPQACQFSATQISLLLVSGMVNTYGVLAAAAVGASNKAGTFAQLPGQALNTGVLTTTAQNLPKNNYKRILQSMLCALAIGLMISIGFSALAIFSPITVLGVFTSNSDVVSIGSLYLTLLSLGFIIENIIYATTGVVSGAGYTPITMTASMLAAAGRVIFSVILINTTALGIYSIGLAALIAPVIPVIIMIIVLLSGKWKTSRIQKEMSAFKEEPNNNALFGLPE